jgi:hypothetical protein
MGSHEGRRRPKKTQEAIYQSALLDIPLELPWWITILDQAAEWGMPPWRIAGDSDKLIWHFRWVVYKEETGRAARERNTHNV